MAAEAICAPLRGEFPEADIRVERLWDYPGLGTPSDAGVVNFVKGLTGANGTIKVAFGTEGGLFDARLGHTHGDLRAGVDGAGPQAR